MTTILEALLNLEYQAVIELDVSMRIGQSDHDAAVILDKIFAQYADQKTYGEVEEIIFAKLAKTISDNDMDFTAADVRAWFDALFWFRLMTAMYLAKNDDTEEVIA